MNQEYKDSLAKAVKATEYKYFGDYELSPDQWDAVETLVHLAKQCAGIEPASWMYTRITGDTRQQNQHVRIHRLDGKERQGWFEQPLYFIAVPDLQP